MLARIKAKKSQSFRSVPKTPSKTTRKRITNGEGGLKAVKIVDKESVKQGKERRRRLGEREVVREYGRMFVYVYIYIYLYVYTCKI